MRSIACDPAPSSPAAPTWPPPWTRPSSAVAVDPQEHAQGRAIVIFSDGEDHAQRWSSRLERLRQQDIVVHAVSIGDVQVGHPVPTGKADQPLTFQGQTVLSKRSDTDLEAIARGTGGTIVKLGLACRRSRLALRIQDRAAWPAASIRRRDSPARPSASRSFCSRPSQCSSSAVCPPDEAGIGAGAGVEARTGLGRCVAPGPPPYSSRLSWRPAPFNSRRKPPRNQPRRQWPREGTCTTRNGFEEALKSFETAIARAPQSAIAQYNAAAALFQLHRYAEARERYLEARLRASPILRIKIDYALGNTALALGELAAAIKSYDDCLSTTAGGA